ncbi:MAG: citrate lyase acyl carrier protein [Aliivibrio sp.]|uniref:citrate lyase acyl carrier protein n=1 Tax=Aliivibrio sp. TaxID=1872443 RepID=UPI001A49321E|nr:citrate lyase acyl carrier protein [Aliivibrio sp.]
MNIVQQALAGTLESSDILIRIGPNSQNIVTVELHSSVKKQFGEEIEATIRNTLDSMGITQAHVVVDDKGALDCVIKARVQAAALRASDETDNLNWSQLS